jgi:site-specific recombinase XerC
VLHHRKRGKPCSRRGQLAARRSQSLSAQPAVPIHNRNVGALERPFGDACGCRSVEEQLTLNQRVSGSSPATPTNKNNNLDQTIAATNALGKHRVSRSNRLDPPGVLHDSPINETTRQKVKERRNEIVSESGAVSANRSHSALCTFYAWAIDRGHLTGANPTADIKPPNQSKRTRVLSEAELVDIRLACGNDDFGRASSGS